MMDILDNFEITKDEIIEAEEQEDGFHICGDCVICKTKIIAN
jgi:hypothetical protein